MEDFDFKQLTSWVEKSVRQSYKARIGPDDKPINNVANFGATVGDIAKVERSGEYAGVGVEFL